MVLITLWIKEQEREIKRFSSQFYTIIPYACGMAVPPAIKDSDALKEKVEQLKLLEELLVVQEKMGTGNLDLEHKYMTLNCDIKAVHDISLINLITNYAILPLDRPTVSRLKLTRSMK